MATETLRIGSKLPVFNLMAVDDNFYSQESFNDKKGIVVMFSCNHCPYVQAYEERVKEIQNKYKNELQIIAINSNDDINYPDDSFEKMKERAKEQNFNFLYLRDSDQSVAKLFGATHTPELFLFNEKRELTYHGKVDDNWKDPDLVSEKYLQNAIEEMLNNKIISIPETFSIGCTIKWK